MMVEKAILTAIEYERRVHDVYARAAEQAKNQVGKRLFRALAKEEKRHVEFLGYELDEWKDTGHVSPEHLKTAIPSRDRMLAEVAKLETPIGDEDRGEELEMLRKALAVEIETSAFYRRMVEELPEGARALFARFLEIEDGHLAVVQAEIDYFTGKGFWFDMQEFDLEKE
jgi:rubrerythrin